MRLIGPLQGYALFREHEEEYLPQFGSVQRELIELLVGRYGFQGFPVWPPGTMPQSTLIFGGGRLTRDGESFAINQLLMTQNADLAVTVTTEQAQAVLDDLVNALDNHLGFHLGSASKELYLLSNVVVEFDPALEQSIQKLSRIADAINDARPNQVPFNIKRIAFGEGDVQAVNDPVTMVQRAEFLIERRQGFPYEANRYFCSAPMSTTEHIRVLEQIEAVARSE